MLTILIYHLMTISAANAVTGYIGLASTEDQSVYLVAKKDSVKIHSELSTGRIFQMVGGVNITQATGTHYNIYKPLSIRGTGSGNLNKSLLYFYRSDGTLLHQVGDLYEGDNSFVIQTGTSLPLNLYAGADAGWGSVNVAGSQINLKIGTNSSGVAAVDKLVITNSEIQTPNKIAVSNNKIVVSVGSSATAGEGVTIHGSSSGNANYSYISFKDSVGTTRYGYCGLGTTIDQSMYLVGEKDPIKIHCKIDVQLHRHQK